MRVNDKRERDVARKSTTETGAENEGRVFLKRDADGNWRARWYGRWMTNGKNRETSLCAWQGTPPDNPAKEEGSAAFEQSRERARKQLKEAMEGRRDADEELRDAQKIHALRYGYRVDRVKIADLAAKWDALPHKADLTEERRERVHSVLRTFKTFLAGKFPNVKETGALTSEHFKAFLDSVEADGLSARSWNDYLSILRGVLAKVDGQSQGFREYLARLPKRTESTIHRRPFDNGELNAIFAAAEEVDPELHPVIVAAACTALRRGDVCRLQWKSVDLADGFATVKTIKTGETVDIPIFPPFMAVLKEAERKRKRGVPYIWPEIALAYARNPDGLNYRLGKVLEAAGFTRPKRPKETADGDEDGGEEGPGRKEPRGSNAGRFESPEDEEAAAVLLEDGMAREGWTAKRREKARRILSLHFEGRSATEIADEIGTSKGAVSDYFRTMEEVGQMALVSTPKRKTPALPTLADGNGEQRKRRGSLCGWHSFRTTFCTLALANGVPMELLQKITGHRTAEIVLKHYDRRGRDAMRKAIGDAMPRAIAGAVGGTAKREGKRQKSAKTKTGGKGDVDFEAVALPPRLAALLDKATPEQLRKVAEMLKKGGDK